MNRIIKFRAWIKSGFDEDIKPFMANVSIIRFEAGNMETDEDDNLWDLENDVELMQFTGLIDKNGKGIFEGDLVKYTMDVEYIYPVVFWNGEDGYQTPGFGIDCGTKHGHALSMNIIEACGLEVIGNVWENPELLKE